mmetsp:Transcript_17350/g.31246  ORF Transcript_17350/g.31246 Transcript_17350/m.31246 type:complete len:486 (+) Transcript_17350:628-2085(+)
MSRCAEACKKAPTHVCFCNDKYYCSLHLGLHLNKAGEHRVVSLNDHIRLEVMMKHKAEITEYEGLMLERLQSHKSERDVLLRQIEEAESELIVKEQEAIKTATSKVNRVKQELSAWTVKIYECLTQTFDNERKRLKQVKELVLSPVADFESLRSCAKTLALEKSILGVIEEETERLTHILSKLKKTLQPQTSIQKVTSLDPVASKRLGKLRSLPVHPISPRLDFSFVSSYPYSARLSKGRLASTDLRTGQRFNIESQVIETGSRVTSLDDGVFLLTGGFKQSQSCYKLNLCTSTIQAQSLMMTGRYSHSTVTLPNGVMVTGGYNKGALRSVEIWEHGIWTDVSSLLYPRYDHSSTSHSSHVYVVGGRCNSQDLLDSIEVWDGLVWALLSVKMPVKVQNPCILSINPDEIFIAGGRGFDNKPLSATWILSETDLQFTEGPQLMFGDDFNTEGLIDSNGVVIEGSKGTHKCSGGAGEFTFEANWSIK